MSLLTDASLLLTPNAYKEGKLYSVIPSNGNGDFTATRATTATRVNSAGLVDLVPYNLNSYSEMFADASWTKAACSITANTVIAPDGTLTADTLSIGIDASSQRHRCYQSRLFEAGVAYTYSVYVKQNQFTWIQIVSQNTAFDVNAWCNFDLQNGVIGNSGGNYTSQTITSVGNGWWRISVTATATITANSNIEIIVPTNGTNTGRYPTWQSLSAVDCYYIWGAQTVEGTLTRNYLRTETRLNIPRLDYSLGSCPNILLEPQRTNLALQSSSFDNASWVKLGSTITANSTTSPSGVVDADTITRDGTSQFNPLTQAIAVTTGTTYTLSVYAKKGTNNFIQIFAATALFTSNFFANFDLNTGVVGSVGSAATASIQDVGNGWYRCTITGAAISTGAANAFSISLVTSSTAPRGQSNTLTTSVFLWGAQLEAGAYSTSFIPTTTASVTRNLDNITRSNVFTNGLITASGGTWFVEIRGNVPVVRDLSTSGIFLNTGVVSTIGNGLVLRNPGVSVSRMGIFTVVAGGLSSNLYTIPTDNAKIAFKWNGATADVFVNGVKVVSATAFTPTAMQNLIGEGNNRAIYINEMALFPTPLTDTQCIALTT